MYKLVFHEEADREFIEDYIWYELQKDGLGEEFREAVGEVLQKIKENPQRYGFSRKPFREISVRKFPYTIVFEIEPEENIVIVAAIYHTSRNPRKKYRP